MSAPVTDGNRAGERCDLVIRASAGTGKTYQLTNRFLALLAGEAAAPDRILATTFTRKAAGEILQRLLGRLCDACEDDRELLALNEALRSADLTQSDARRLLELTVGQLDRLHVRTLDSFFAHLVGLFGLDLGMPPGWSIADEDGEQDLRSLAVTRLVRESTPDELVELLRILQREDPGRAAHEALLDAVRKAHATWLESAPEAWTAIAAPPRLEAARVEALVAELEAVDPPTTKKGTPVKRWVARLEEVVAALRDSDFDGFLGNGLVVAALEGRGSYDRHAIEPELERLLGDLAGHAGSFVLGRVVAECEHLRDLLQRFDAAEQAVKRERRAYGFGDMPRLLRGAGVLGGRVGDVAFRLGARIDHLLLDEFQDTSVGQWDVLQPLADGILEAGDERTFFCVGDVKQAIYAWREGEARLLTGLGSRHDGVVEQPLSQSWRSAPVILQTVNRVFGDLGAATVWRDPAPAAEAAAFSADFDDHVPSPRTRELPGAARLIEVPGVDGTASQRARAVNAFAARHVAALARKHPEATVGVLVRYTRHIPALLAGIRRNGLAASGEGGQPLTDSRAVLLALSALWRADHPSDPAAAFHVSRSPLPDLVEGEDGPRRLRRRLVDEGYGPVLVEWLERVEACGDFGPWDRRRFAQLVDLGFAWDERASLRPSRFVAFVRRRKVDDPVPARIKVMTVHKAKGLEFDAVVLPDLDDDLVGTPGPLLKERPDPFGPVTRVFPAVRSALLPLSPDVAALHESCLRRDLKEELCVLYVAMTRAKRHLDMIVAAPYAKTSRPRSAAELLRETLGAGEPDDAGVIWQHEDSRREALEPDADAPPAPTAEPVPAALGLAPDGPTRWMTRRSPSAEGADGEDAADLLGARGREARARGTLVHAFFEAVEWWDGRPPDVDDLVALGERTARRQRLALDAATIREEAERFGARLAGEEIGALMTDDGEGEREVWRERAFALTLDAADGPELVSGAFDRVVVRREGGAPVSAAVIDFKTDRPPAGAARGEAGHAAWRAERASHHGPQLGLYRRALARMLGLEEAAVSASLALLEADAVVELPPG